MKNDQSYKHKGTDHNAFLLHDACITSVSQDGTKLTLGFEQGFWITTKHPDNPHGKILRTDSSALVFELEYEFFSNAEIYVVQKGLFRRILLKTWALDKLKEYLKSKGYYFCVIDYFKEYNDHLLCGHLYSESKNRQIPCAIRMHAPDPLYCWNNICVEAEW